MVRLDQGGEVATVSCREGWVMEDMEDTEAMEVTEAMEAQEVTLHCDAGRWVGQGRACRGGLVYDYGGYLQRLGTLRQLLCNTS